MGRHALSRRERQRLAAAVLDEIEALLRLKREQPPGTSLRWHAVYAALWGGGGSDFSNALPGRLPAGLRRRAGRRRISPPAP
jgi:hypothetical protein